MLLQVEQRVRRTRQEVINRLQFVPLPSGMQAQLSPWNAIGELFRYTVRGKGYTTRDLKTAEDWILERQFKQVPGVIDVISFGGETKQYHVEVDPFRLRGQGVTLSQLIAGIQAANQNVGGQRLIIGEQSYNVRGIGLIRDVHDIENVVVAEQKGVPIRVKDVADAQIGLRAAPRHRRPRRRAGRRPGHRPHALRRRDAQDARGHPRAHRLHPQVPHPAAGHGHRARTTTAATS